MSKRGKFKLNTKAQVWVETVIYTLIGLAIIGLLLAAVKPQLDKQQDRALIEQSINSLGIIDERIYDTLGGIGNRRKLELRISKGQLTIDSPKNKIIWEIDSRYEYSEEDVKITAGKVQITTLPGNPYKVILEIEYPFDLKFNNEQNSRTFGQSSTPHMLTVENLGVQNQETVINFNDI